MAHSARGGKVDDDAVVVQELTEGVPEIAEEDVPQLGPTALEGVAVDDDTRYGVRLPHRAKCGAQATPFAHCARGISFCAILDL